MGDSARGLVGILLAAGRGERFDSTGTCNKLLQPLADGTPVAIASAKNMLTAVPDVLAVVRAGDEVLSAQLQEAGCRVSTCANADKGMSASLVHGLSQASYADAWVIALADMPYVHAITIRSLAIAITEGARIAVPTCHGKRGNPVVFHHTHLVELLRLRGDAGARHLLKSLPVVEVETGDQGIHQDIDTIADLQADPPARR